MTPQPRDWRALAEQLSDEMDPNKFTALVTELNEALEHEEKQRNPRYSEVTNRAAQTPRN
jgi:hypothetical protein